MAGHSEKGLRWADQAVTWLWAQNGHNNMPLWVTIGLILFLGNKQAYEVIKYFSRFAGSGCSYAKHSGSGPGDA
jgi:hypothetical protein